LEGPGREVHGVFICICNGLTDRRVLEAIASGARTHDEVYEACDCTAQCYSCASEIDAIIDLAAPENQA
jgi:bacterioferritin-associated ferredoxin